MTTFVGVDLSNQIGKFPQDLFPLGFQNKTSPVASSNYNFVGGKSALINAFRQGTRYPLLKHGFCGSPKSRRVLREMLRLC
jgi:hypothetical protein